MSGRRLSQRTSDYYPQITQINANFLISFEWTQISSDYSILGGWDDWKLESLEWMNVLGFKAFRLPGFPAIFDYELSAISWHPMCLVSYLSLPVSTCTVD
jgi:hypothetical protein